MRKKGLLGAYISTIERVGGVRTNVHRLLRPLYVLKEIRRAEERLPGLAQVARRMAESRRALEGEYADYTANVSTDVFALSLETSAFIDSYCHVFRPRLVLDLGSGFSSFVLRRYQRLSGESVTVTSVDDDREWLQRTSTYLSRHGLATEGLVHLDRLGEPGATANDFVCYDLGNFETRRKFLPLALSHTRTRHGVILLDDCHRDSYRELVRRELARRGVQPIQLKELTCDDFGRFCWLASGLGDWPAGDAVRAS